MAGRGRVCSGFILFFALIGCNGWSYGEWCGAPDVDPSGRLFQHSVIARYEGIRAGLFGTEDYLSRILFEDDSAYFFVYGLPRFPQTALMAWGCAADRPRGASPSACDVGVPGILYGRTRLYLGDHGNMVSLCEDDFVWNPPGCIVFSLREDFPYAVVDSVVWGALSFFRSPRGRWEVSGDSSGLVMTYLPQRFRISLPIPAFRGAVAWSPSEDTFCIRNVLLRRTGAAVETLRVYADTLRCAAWGPGTDAITVITEDGERFFWMTLDGWAWGSVPEWTYETERPVERVRWIDLPGDTLLLVDRRVIHPREGVRKILGPGCTGAPPNR